MNSVRATQRNQRANPVARQPGSIDVNTKIDSKFLHKSKHSGHAQMGGTADTFKRTDVPDTVYDVTAGEILMAVKKGQSRYRGKTNLCFSSANGLPKDESFLDELVFAGMSVTAYDGKNDKPREEQGFVATYAGLVTTMNTGKEPIYPGDLVRVTMPPLDDGKRPSAKRACPKEKVVFGLTPVTKTDMEAVFRDANAVLPQDPNPINRAVNAIRVGADGQARMDAVEELIATVVRKMQYLRRFEIGRALGHAVSGQTLDICVG